MPVIWTKLAFPSETSGYQVTACNDDCRFLGPPQHTGCRIEHQWMPTYRPCFRPPRVL